MGGYCAYAREREADIVNGTDRRCARGDVEVCGGAGTMEEALAQARAWVDEHPCRWTLTTVGPRMDAFGPVRYHDVEVMGPCGEGGGRPVAVVSLSTFGDYDRRMWDLLRFITSSRGELYDYEFATWGFQSFDSAWGAVTGWLREHAGDEVRRRAAAGDEDLDWLA